MGKEQPIKLYFLITFLLIIIIVYSGLILKNFLSERLPSKDAKEEEDVKESLPEEIRQSRAIFSIGFVIFIVLAVIFTVSKVLTARR